jgi:hypothetical protein
VTIFWKIVAALLAVGAVAWIIVENFDRAFLFAAAGAVAWFLSYRAQLREKLTANEQERETDEDEVDEEENL